MKSIIQMSVISSLLMLGACTTVTKEQRSYYNQAQKKLQSQPVGVLTNGCFVRVELGKDDILFEQSEKTAKATADILEQQLKLNNISVSKKSNPLVCGQLTKATLLDMDIRKTAKSDDVKNTTYPLVTATPVNTNVNNAVIELYTVIEKAKKQASSKALSIPFTINANVLNTLKGEFKTNKVFVVQASGSKASFASKMTVGALTAIATGGAYASTLNDGQRYSIYLIDLDASSITWSKVNQVLQGKVFKEKVTIGSRNDFLTPLYEKK